MRFHQSSCLFSHCMAGHRALARRPAEHLPLIPLDLHLLARNVRVRATILRSLPPRAPRDDKVFWGYNCFSSNSPLHAQHVGCPLSPQLVCRSSLCLWGSSPQSHRHAQKSLSVEMLFFSCSTCLIVPLCLDVLLKEKETLHQLQCGGSSSSISSFIILISFPQIG